MIFSLTYIITLMDTKNGDQALQVALIPIIRNSSKKREIKTSTTNIIQIPHTSKIPIENPNRHMLR